MRRAAAHGQRHAGAHHVHGAAGHDLAVGGELSHRVGRKGHDVEGFTGLHALGGVHAAHRFELDGHARVGLLVEVDQVGQHLFGGHGRNDADGGRHAVSSGCSRLGRGDAVLRREPVQFNRKPGRMPSQGARPRSLLQTWRRTIISLILPIASAGFRPLGQTSVQFRIVRQRNRR
ncbi:hypothetical protein FQZ97_850290 [compost metagenome]